MGPNWYHEIMRRSTGFSLIELLVVIAIIGVLMVLILPGLTGAMERARQTKCLANGRQTVVALAAYEGDFKQQFPSMPVPAGQSVVTNQHIYGGVAGLFSLQQQGDGASAGFVGGSYANGSDAPLLRSYMTSFAALVCPSDREDRYYGMPYGPGGNTSYAAATSKRPVPAAHEEQVVSYNISYVYFTGMRDTGNGAVPLWADETNGPDINNLAWYGPMPSSANSTAAGAVSAGRYGRWDNHKAHGGNFLWSDGSGRWEKNDRSWPPAYAPTCID